MRAPNKPLRLIRQYREYIPYDEAHLLPAGLRGIYVLYNAHPAATGKFSVVYVGMASRGGMRARLRTHKRTKRSTWTHCSVFEVWPNVSDEEVAEIEGILRHIFRYDPDASGLNKQRGYKALRKQPVIALRAHR